MELCYKNWRMIEEIDSIYKSMENDREIWCMEILPSEILMDFPEVILFPGATKVLF